MKPIEHSNLKDWICTRRISGLINLKEKINLCGESEMRNRLFNKVVQEIAKNWRIAAKKQIELDKKYVVMLQEMECYDCEPIVDSNSEQSEFLVWCKRILRSWYSEQLWSDPRSLRTLGHSESQKSAKRDSGLPLIHGIPRVYQGNFKSLPAWEGPSSSIFETQRIWHRPLEEKEYQSRTVRQYQLHVLIGALQPWIFTAVLEELMLSLVWWITRCFRSRKCISVNSLTPWSFQSWKVNSKTEVYSKSAHLNSQCTGSKNLR